MDEKPTLLLCENMEQTIDYQLLELNQIINTPNKINFLYSFTLLEGTVWQILRQLCVAFPDRIVGKEKNYTLQIDFNSFLLSNDYYDVLEEFIKDRLEKKSKANICEYIKYLEQIAEVNIKFDECELGEISKERNKIAHNNAMFFRENKVLYSNNHSKTDLEYAKHMDVIKKIIEEIKTKMILKYKDYDRKKMLIEAWKYTMPSVMRFSDIFESSDGHIFLKLENAQRLAKMISSGERNIFQIWLENYDHHLMYDIMKDAGHVSSDSMTTLQEQASFLRKMFKEYPYILSETKMD